MNLSVTNPATRLWKSGDTVRLVGDGWYNGKTGTVVGESSFDDILGRSWNVRVMGGVYRFMGLSMMEPTTNADKVADALGNPGEVPSGYDRSDWNA